MQCCCFILGEPPRALRVPWHRPQSSVTKPAFLQVVALQSAPVTKKWIFLSSPGFDAMSDQSNSASEVLQEHTQSSRLILLAGMGA